MKLKIRCKTFSKKATINKRENWIHFFEWNQRMKTKKSGWITQDFCVHEKQMTMIQLPFRRSKKVKKITAIIFWQIRWGFNKSFEISKVNCCIKFAWGPWTFTPPFFMAAPGGECLFVSSSPFLNLSLFWGHNCVFEHWFWLTFKSICSFVW